MHEVSREHRHQGQQKGHFSSGRAADGSIHGRFVEWFIVWQRRLEFPISRLTICVTLQQRTFWMVVPICELYKKS